MFIDTRGHPTWASARVQTHVCHGPLDGKAGPVQGVFLGTLLQKGHEDVNIYMYMYIQLYITYVHAYVYIYMYQETFAYTQNDPSGI